MNPLLILAALFVIWTAGTLIAGVMLGRITAHTKRDVLPEPQMIDSDCKPV